MPTVIELLRRWQPRFIQALPSAALPLARWLSENPAPDISTRIRCIQLYGENIYADQLARLREVFGCQVLADYSHAERAVRAFTLPGDPRWYCWPLYGKVELFGADGRPVTEPGLPGEIVATGFDNRAMPLIRYRTGDLACWSAAPNPQHPGVPVLERLEGRLQEYLVCRDRRVVPLAALGAAMQPALSVAERFQFEQHRPGHVLLKVQVQRKLPGRMARQLAQAVRACTQDGIRAEVIRAPALPAREPGAHPLVLQHLDLSTFLGAAASEPRATPS